MLNSEIISLSNSWRIQRRVIGALMLREMLTRYGRHNLGFLWLFLEPMIFTLGVTTLWTITKSIHHSTLPIAAFAITGYSSVLLWRNMPNRTIGGIGPNLSLMYHRNVKVIDIFVSRLSLEIAGATMSFFVLSIIFISLEWIKPPEDILKVIFGWFMLAWFGAGLALFLGAMNERSELTEKLWHPASYLIFPLSGAAFLVDALPKNTQELLLLLPMVNGVEMVRDGYFGSQIISHYSVIYMATFNSILTFLALITTHQISQLVTPE